MVQISPGTEGGHFRIHEEPDSNGGLRLTVVGELDLASAPTFTHRLARLRDAGARVVIDLGKTDFIDSTGLRAVLVAVTDARSVGWNVEVAPEVSDQAGRLIDMTGVGPLIWPVGESDGHSRHEA